MREPKHKILWGYIAAAFIVTVMLSGTALYISHQHNQTQKEIAEEQTKAINELTDRIGVGAMNIRDGLTDIKTSICKTSDKNLMFC